MIERTLEYDFERERKFDYRGLSEEAFVAHFAAFIAGIWQIHPFREGNTRTTAMFAIKYLRSKGFDVTNDLFARESWYFRNALVRANYENTKLDVVKETIYLEEFLKVLLYGCEIEPKNRYLRIGWFRTGSGGGAACLTRARGYERIGVMSEVNDLPENAEALVGREFVHFKGGHYRLRAFATNTETRETMVVYEALYGDGGLWVRPAKMFFETVTRDGRSFPRFKPL